MQCPIDQTTLVIADRQGIEIDYCPKCRGVWLDRGELDKLIERVGPAAPSVREPARREEPRPQYDERQRYEYDDDSYRRDDGHHKKHKRESAFGNLFDF